MDSRYLYVVVEGPSDEAPARRILQHVGCEPVQVLITDGKDRLDQQLPSYNQAARRNGWLVLRDLDREECAPGLKSHLLPTPTRGMLLRIAVREVEAWLLADREEAAQWLRVSPAIIPSEPDSLLDPKQTLVRIARRSRSRTIREEMVPRAGSTARVGPAYTGQIIQYASSQWRPQIAAQNSPSLARCPRSLERWKSGNYTQDPEDHNDPRRVT